MTARGTLVLSFDERKVIEEMLSQHKTVQATADRLKRSHSCIKSEIKRNGGRNNYKAADAQNRYDTMQLHKSNILSTAFSPLELQIIKQGIEDRLPMSRIRDLASCSYSKLYRYFIVNGIKYLPQHFQGFEERISSLEMQVEILTDQLKEILNERSTKNN